MLATLTPARPPAHPRAPQVLTNPGHCYCVILHALLPLAPPPEEAAGAATTAARPGDGSGGGRGGAGGSGSFAPGHCRRLVLFSGYVGHTCHLHVLQFYSYAPSGCPVGRHIKGERVNARVYRQLHATCMPPSPCYLPPCHPATCHLPPCHLPPLPPTHPCPPVAGTSATPATCLPTACHLHATFPLLPATCHLPPCHLPPLPPTHPCLPVAGTSATPRLQNSSRGTRRCAPRRCCQGEGGVGAELSTATRGQSCAARPHSTKPLIVSS
jgi:hypothetical protein